MEFLDTFTDSRPVLLSEVDFDWVTQCQSVQQIKSAIEQLEKEHYPELLATCRERLEQLEPSQSTIAKQQEQKQKDAIKIQIRDSLIDCEQKEKELQNQFKSISIRDSSRLHPVRSVKSTETTNTEVKQSNSVESKKSLTAAEHAMLFQRAKASGNDSYRALEFEPALNHYRRAAEHRDQAGLKDSTVETNLAITCIKLKRYDHALEHCEHALRDDLDNWKALWRKAQAQEGLCLFRQALENYRTALSKCSETARAKDITKDKLRCEKKWTECDGGKSSKPIHPAPSTLRRMNIVEEDSSDDEKEEYESKQSVSQAYRSKSGFLVEVLDD